MNNSANPLTKSAAFSVGFAQFQVFVGKWKQSFPGLFQAKRTTDQVKLYNAQVICICKQLAT